MSALGFGKGRDEEEDDDDDEEEEEDEEKEEDRSEDAADVSTPEERDDWRR